MRLAVFARPPLPGSAKTRLAPAVGDAGAAALAGAFLADTLAHAVEAGLPVTAWIAGDPFHSSLAPFLPTDLDRQKQPDLDLGARMAAALARALDADGRGLVVGTDAPTLPPRLLTHAAALLEAHEVVIGPAADRGYYLVGARGRVPPIFDGVTWSTPHVLRDTLTLAARAALDVALLPPWYDVDTPADLLTLRAHLALDPRAAPATSLALSALGLGTGP